MRYYRVDVSNAKSGAPVYLTGFNNTPLTSLTQTGTFNPSALNVELDIYQTPYHVAAPGSYFRVWGPALEDIASATNFNGLDIKIALGMSAGLPLANPAQAQRVITGTIYQSFGNWIGKDMTLEWQLASPAGTAKAPKPFILNWAAGTPLSQALAATFKSALPDAKQLIQISPKLTYNHFETGFYSTLAQFAEVIFGMSRDIISDPTYPGVAISYDGVQISAIDGTVKPTAKVIAFQDLIGQPTWLASNLISIKFVMRGDLDIGNIIQLPQTLITNNAAALTRFRDKSTFTGNYTINNLRHVGNFRQADASSWCTIAEAYPTPAT